MESRKALVAGAAGIDLPNNEAPVPCLIPQLTHSHCGLLGKIIAREVISEETIFLGRNVM
jgi:hypothetical protein